MATEADTKYKWQCQEHLGTRIAEMYLYDCD